ncbi:hypothetical protein Tco_0250265 [Tanacetum coccineum]
MDNSGRNNVVYSLVQRDETYGSGDITKKGFWSDVFDNFGKDMGGTIREYDVIVSKWKNLICLKVVAFSVVYDGVQRIDENMSSNFVVRLCINPMIQPEPEDLPKDNPNLEIAVLSSGLILHQMMSDHNSSDLAPQRQEMSVENVSSGLQRRQIRHNKGWNFSSVYYNPTHGNAKDNSSGLVLHQMTSDHNRSELRIHDHSNEPSSSKLVPKVVPLAVKTATSRQELGLLFHLHIAMLRTTGINPMIQPEPEDLPKDNPKLEIAVLRWQSAPASEY